MGRKRILCLALTLLFILTGGLSLWRSEAMLRQGGKTAITAVRLAESGARAVEFRPDCTRAGSAGAVLLLSRFGDGSRALASELARRGMTVLVARAQNAAEAWDALASLPYARLSSLGLLAGKSGADTALSLADSLVGAGKEPGAVVLCGASVREAAEESAARNILLFVGKNDNKESLALQGYFSEGTARCARPLGASWRSGATVAALLDWLGSSLGHTVELPDDDLQLRAHAAWIWLTACAWTAAALALVTGLCRKHR